MKIAQLYLTLCIPMDCCPPGSFLGGILQDRILEWVAIPFSRGSSQPRDQTGKFFTTNTTWEALASACQGLPWWQICLQCGGPGFDPWVRKIPWRREPTLVSLPEEFHGQGSLTRCSPWGCKELDTTERLKNSSLGAEGMWSA